MKYAKKIDVGICYIASCSNDFYMFFASDDTEARHWVINHLDTSIDWDVFRDVDRSKGKIKTK